MSTIKFAVVDQSTRQEQPNKTDIIRGPRRRSHSTRGKKSDGEEAKPILLRELLRLKCCGMRGQVRSLDRLVFELPLKCGTSNVATMRVYDGHRRRFYVASEQK